MSTLCLIFHQTSSDCFFFQDLNQAEFLMTSLMQLIEKQSSENKNLADKNIELLQQVNK